MIDQLFIVIYLSVYTILIFLIAYAIVMKFFGMTQDVLKKVDTIVSLKISIDLLTLTLKGVNTNERQRKDT